MSRASSLVARPDQAPAAGTAAEPGRAGFRPDIEGLRAVAILLVVLYHAGVPVLTGGYVGVDVFFVISGFLITSQLYDELTRTGRISIRAFYARRAARLLPAATLVIAVTVLASWRWLPPTRFAAVAHDAVAASGYAINYRLAIQGTDYLAAARAPSPLQHFWSLSVEEQFYLIWPLLLLTVAGIALRRGRGATRPAVLVLSGITVLSFAVGVWQTGDAAPWAYFGAPARIWELGVGALLALGRPLLARTPRMVARIGAWAGVGAIVLAAVWFSDATPFPGFAAALPVLGAAGILAAGGAPGSPGVARLLGFGVFRVLGRLSYSWYLWHWPVLIIVPAAVNGSLTPVRGLALIAVALVLAALTYVLVENPVRFRRSLRTRPWRGIALGASLSASAAALALVMTNLIPATVGTGTAVDTTAAVAGSADPARELASLVAAGAAVRDVPANLTPAPTAVASDIPPIYQDGCHADFDNDRVKTPCAYGDLRSATSIVLFGDSHAAQWFAALNAVAIARHWRLVVITKSACSAASAVTWLSNLKREYTECARWRAAALDHIRALRPRFVVMSALTIGTPPVGATDAERAWTDAWVTTFHALRPSGAKLVLLADTPWPHGNVPDCVSAHLHDVGSCATPTDQAILVPHLRAMVADAATREGVRVIDPVPWLCTAQTCPVIVGNLLVYRDESHLSTAYSSLLARLLYPELS